VKLKVSDVDFWSKKYDYHMMKFRHDKRMYPPNISLLVYSEVDRRATICIEVEGMKDCEPYSLKISKHFLPGECMD